MAEKFTLDAEDLKISKEKDFSYLIAGLKSEVFDGGDGKDTKDGKNPEGDPAIDPIDQYDGKPGDALKELYGSTDVKTYIESLTPSKFAALRKDIIEMKQKYNDEFTANNKLRKESLTKVRDSKNESISKIREKYRDKASKTKDIKEKNELGKQRDTEIAKVDLEYKDKVSKISLEYNDKNEAARKKNILPIYLGFFPLDKQITDLKGAVVDMLDYSQDKLGNKKIDDCIKVYLSPDIEYNSKYNNIVDGKEAYKSSLHSCNIYMKEGKVFYDYNQEGEKQTVGSVNEIVKVAGNKIVLSESLAASNIKTFDALRNWVASTKDTIEKSTTDPMIELRKNYKEAFIKMNALESFMSEMDKLYTNKEVKITKDNIEPARKLYKDIQKYATEYVDKNIKDKKIKEDTYSKKITNYVELVKSYTNTDTKENYYTKLGQKIDNYDGSIKNATNKFVAKFNLSNTAYNKIENKEDLASLKGWVEYVKNKTIKDEVLLNKLITSSSEDIKSEYTGKYLVGEKDQINLIVGLSDKLKSVNEKIQELEKIALKKENNKTTVEVGNGTSGHKILYDAAKGTMDKIIANSDLSKYSQKELETLMKCLFNVNDLNEHKDMYIKFKESDGEMSDDVINSFLGKYNDSKNFIGNESVIVDQLYSNRNEFTAIMDKITSGGKVGEDNENETEEEKVLHQEAGSATNIFLKDKDKNISIYEKVALEKMMRYIFKSNSNIKKIYNEFRGEDPALITNELSKYFIEPNKKTPEESLINYFREDKRAIKEKLIQIMEKIYPSGEK